LTLVSALRGAFLVQEERKEMFEKRAKCRAGKYQVNHIGYMEYEVENIDTGDTWNFFKGQRLTQLSHAFDCARFHQVYDQEEIQ
jgi:hypothetical protein